MDKLNLCWVVLTYYLTVWFVHFQPNAGLKNICCVYTMYHSVSPQTFIMIFEIGAQPDFTGIRKYFTR